MLADILKPLFFFHIPKTGGTSLAEALKRLFLPTDILSNNGNVDLDYLCSNNDRLDDQIFIHGHPGHGIMRYLAGRVRTITFLRNPMDHVVSNYLHLISDLNNPDHAEALGLGFCDFLLTHPYYAVFQTGSLVTSLAEEPGLTLENVEYRAGQAFELLDSFYFVGILERFQESYAALGQLLGDVLPFPIVKLNKATDRGISPEDIAALHVAYEQLRADSKISYLLALEEAIYFKATALLNKRLNLPNAPKRDYSVSPKGSRQRHIGIPASCFQSPNGFFEGDCYRCDLWGVSGHAIYGPYERIPSGLYDAKFLISLPGIKRKRGSTIQIEVVANGTFLASRALPDYLDISDYLCTIRFDHRSSDSDLEFRIGVSGVNRGVLEFRGIELTVVQAFETFP